MIAIVVCGAMGRMGKRILSCAHEDPEIEIVGAVERSKHDDLGQDAGELAGIGSISVPLTDLLEGCVANCDAVVDFSAPESALKHVELACGAGKASVVGTTGLSPEDREKIEECAKEIPIVVASNMSVGMNLLFDLVGEVAGRLGDAYDIEIVEAHHRFKKDAPSGSARTLAGEICKATGRSLEKAGVFGREGLVGERKSGEIGVHAVRGGDIVGDHTVIYSTLGERVELTHRAHSRDTFARGALRAAKFVSGRTPGLYDMRDVLK